MQKEQIAKQRRFILLACLVVLGRMYDVTTTYLYTPDLKHETNIIVKFLGAGWGSVVVIQALLVALTIYLLHYYFFKYRPVYPAQKGLNIKQVASYLNFGDIQSYDKLFYMLPQNRQMLYASTGYVTAMTLIGISYIIGTSTTLLLISEGYRKLYAQGIVPLMYTIIVLLAIWFSINFYRIAYREYREQV